MVCITSWATAVPSAAFRFHFTVCCMTGFKSSIWRVTTLPSAESLAPVMLMVSRPRFGLPLASGVRENSGEP